MRRGVTAPGGLLIIKIWTGGWGEASTAIFVTREEVPLLCGLQRLETEGSCATSASPPFWVNGVQPGRCDLTEINFYKPWGRFAQQVELRGDGGAVGRAGIFGLNFWAELNFWKKVKVSRF